MNRLQTCGLLAIAAAALLVADASAHDATLLFQDIFDDMSHISVGDLDSGRATYSIAASPDGKEGNSLQASYDGAEGANWVHRKHDLGGSVPATGVVTYMWSYMLSGVFDEGKMGFTSDAGTYYPMPFTLAEVRGGAENMGALINDAWHIHPGSGGAFGPVELDKWHTFALVIDMDSTTDNASTYMAQGFEVTSEDHWFDASVDIVTYPIVQWQHYKYAYGANGAWDVYIDDLSVYDGMAIDIIEWTPGDANKDGYVDVTDLGILATNYGESEKTWEEGDFTGDGLVNVSDLGELATNYGTGPTSDVPEPSTLSLLVIGAFVSLLALRRR